MQCTDLNSGTLMSSQCTLITHYYAQRNHFHMGDILDKNIKIHTQKSTMTYYVWDWFKKHMVPFILAGHVIKNAYKQILD
jgi:hypothetical protein